MFSREGTLRRKELQALEEQTHLSGKELRRLRARYESLVNDVTLRVDKMVIARQPEIITMPLMPRIVSRYDDAGVTFDEYTALMSKLSPQASGEEKLSLFCAFFGCGERDNITLEQILGFYDTVLGAAATEGTLKSMIAAVVEELGNDIARDGTLPVSSLFHALDEGELSALLTATL